MKEKIKLATQIIVALSAVAGLILSICNRTTIMEIKPTITKIKTKILMTTYKTYKLYLIEIKNNEKFPIPAVKFNVNFDGPLYYFDVYPKDENEIPPPYITNPEKNIYEDFRNGFFEFRFEGIEPSNATNEYNRIIVCFFVDDSSIPQNNPLKVNITPYKKDKNRFTKSVHFPNTKNYNIKYKFFEDYIKSAKRKINKSMRYINEEF